MSIPSSAMTRPDFSVDPYRNVVGMVIDARNAYERLCGMPPTCIYLAGPLLQALSDRGFKEGDQIAGLKIIARTGSVADPAICSRDEHLFHVPKGKRK